MPLGVDVLSVSRKFGSNQALKNISIQFSEGSLHGLIGAEGAGKTTLIRIIMGLLHTDEGKILWKDSGKEISFGEIRDSISYMPGAQSLYGDLSVSEHLDFFRDLYRISKEEYAQQREKLLSITRLDKFLNRRARELSGGMYKKLGLMCALLQKPRALLLDEPTNGVDPISRREFWDMLYALAAEKILIIVSTAYMDEAERCHEVHLMDSGSHLASGDPRKLLAEANVKSFDEYYMNFSKTQTPAEARL